MLRKLTREELEEKIRNRKTAEQLDLHGILLGGYGFVRLGSSQHQL